MRDQNDHPLAARLAQRVAMPGVLDRTPVQRKYDRLQQGTFTHDLSAQLHQRATASGEAGGSSLVWRRAPERPDASAEGLPVPASTTSIAIPSIAAPNIAAASSTPIAQANSPVVQRALPEAEPAGVTERLMSRAQSPGVLAAGSTISRPAATSSFSNAPAFAAHTQSRYGITSSGVTTNRAAAALATVPAAPAPSISRAPTGVIRRQVDAGKPVRSTSSHDAASVAPASSPISRGIETAPMLAPRAPAASAMGSTLPLPSAAKGSPAAPDSRPADSPQATAIPMMPAARPLVSAGPATGAPLVLRRMLAAPAQSNTPLSPLMPPATVQLPREETPAPVQHKPDPAAATKVGAHTGSDIDRIAEEVSRRLMRRLEIERERKGIRQWR